MCVFAQESKKVRETEKCGETETQKERQKDTGVCVCERDDRDRDREKKKEKEGERETYAERPWIPQCRYIGKKKTL